MTPTEQRRILEAHASQLAEHFGSVLILVSHVDQGCTQMRQCGRGDYYAQSGMAQTFLTRRNEMDRAEARDLPPPPSDEERTQS